MPTQSSSRLSIIPLLILFVLLALVIPLPVRGEVTAKDCAFWSRNMFSYGSSDCKNFRKSQYNEKYSSAFKTAVVPAEVPEKSILRFQQEEIVRRDCIGSRSLTCVQDGIVALGSPESYPYKASPEAPRANVGEQAPGS